MANLIRVIGIGPGHPRFITPEALELIRESDILVGGERAVSLFHEQGRELFIIKNNLPEMVEFIRAQCETKKIAVLASGDPAFYGVMEYLKRHFAESELLVSPGVSSMQLACARLCISWHDAALYSVHGRETGGLTALVQVSPKVIVLTDPSRTPAFIAKVLTEAGIMNRKIYVCENLSYDNEQISEFSLENIPEDAGTSGCVMVISNE